MCGPSLTNSSALDLNSASIESTPLVKLLRDGFVVLPGVLSLEEAAIIEREMRVVISESDHNGEVFKPQQSWHWPQRMKNEHVLILRKHLPFLNEILGEDMCHMRSWIRLSPPHGRGTGWHKDHDSLFVPMPVIVGVAIGALTVENGGTHFLGSTQHLPHPIHDSRAYSQEQVATGPAGSLVVFQSGIWHRGGDNKTDFDRWMMFAEFGASQMGRASISPLDFQQQSTEYQYPLSLVDSFGMS